jgi:hypothetical protein
MSLRPPSGAYPFPGPYQTQALLTNLRPNTLPPKSVNRESYLYFDIEWNNPPISGATTTNLVYSFNTLLSTVSPLSSIACIVVDNSYCAWDIHIQFQDGFTLTIPAWEPIAVYPVITSTTAFTVWCERQNPTSFLPVTNVSQYPNNTNLWVCNANIPPINSPPVKKQSFFSTGLNFTGGGQQIFSVDGTFSNAALAGSGILEYIGLNYSFSSAVASAGSISITVLIDNVQFVSLFDLVNQNGATNNVGSFFRSFSNLNIRFNNVATISSVGGSSPVGQITLVYRDLSGNYVQT